MGTSFNSMPEQTYEDVTEMFVKNIVLKYLARNIVNATLRPL